MNPASAHRPPAGATPLTLLCAADPARALALALRWAAGRPPGERWALLIDDPAVPHPESVQNDEALRVVRLASGCVCCSGAIALRIALTRVLRDGPWQRLLLLPSATARVDLLVDALRASLAASWLELDSIVTLRLAGLAAPPGSLDASLLVVDACPDPATAPLLAAPPLAAGPAGVRLHVEEDSLAAEWGAVSASLGLAHGHPSVPVAHPGQSGRMSWLRWPGAQVFDRRRLFAALQCIEHPRIELALFRTAREWYRWSAGTGTDPGWHATGWRLDSRILVRDACADALAAFRRQLQGCIDEGD